jgi:ubiquinone/menaquinone biosynthesis C-methylase UbiE
MDQLLEKTFLAEREHFWFKGFRQFIAPLIDRALAGVSSPRALDCGCGTGTNMALLASRAEVFGFDLTRSGLQYARAQGGERVARASITHIPFRSGEFDLATSFDVLVCLTEEQESRAMRELARVLKPGGGLVVNVAALELLRGSHSVLAEEVRRYTKAMLRTALDRGGLQVERMTYTNFTLFPMMLASRTWQRMRGVHRPEEIVREIAVPSPPVNAALTAVLSLEARALRSIDMPIGSSILCLARKPR